MKHIKLSHGLLFTVRRVGGFVFKKWDEGSGSMLTSMSWEEGYKKSWEVETNQGIIGLSSSQIGSMLEGALDKTGVSNLIGKTFKVKTNGKQGIEIRYFINLVRDAAPETNEDVPF